MTTYESQIHSIPAGDKAVFAKLSNLNNLQALKSDTLQQAGISDVLCEEDSISFNVNNIGQLTLRIVEREEAKTIKLVTANSPFPFTMWIQLVSKAENDTRLKLTLKVDIPAMFKMMVDSKLKTFVNTLAEKLAMIDYTA